MVTTDDQGVTRAIKDIIARSAEAGAGVADGSDLDVLLDAWPKIRDLLAGPWSPAAGRGTPRTCRSIAPTTLRTLRESGAGQHPYRRRRGGRHRPLLPVGLPGLRTPPGGPREPCSRRPASCPEARTLRRSAQSSSS
ncbi:hypothetical protein [Streptomyces avidinii]